MSTESSLLTIGTATEVRGEIVRGTVPLISLPVEIDVNIPIVIASGALDGISLLTHLRNISSRIFSVFLNPDKTRLCRLATTAPSEPFPRPSRC